ncbi:MAG: helix-turn-helix domain-containing protein, partial [Nitrospirae bacterium]
MEAVRVDKARRKVGGTRDMTSLGEYLKEAREAQQLSLTHMASTTRIQETYLKALEEERFDQLPEQVFAKGFVRTYAQALGLDEEEALRRFAEASRAYYAKEEEEKRKSREREEQAQKSKFNRNLVIGLIGVALLAVLFLMPREQSPPSSPQPDTAGSPALSPVPQMTDSSHTGKQGDQSRQKNRQEQAIPPSRQRSLAEARRDQLSTRDRSEQQHTASSTHPVTALTAGESQG